MKVVKRPTILTVICVMSFTAPILGFPTIFSPFIKKKGDFFPAITGILISLEFISVVGVWYMKKWGLRIYILTALLNQTLMLYIDNWQSYKLILPLVFIGFTGFFYKKMDDNL
jgi:hypothetical protein